MKNLFVNNSQATAMSGNRQSMNQLAMMAKFESTKDGVAQRYATQYDEQPVEIDEMQIDKLYQSL